MLKILCSVLLICVMTPSIGVARSLALIIGNDSYTNVTPLQKARADAAGYQDFFSRRGFDVTLRTDLTGRDMIYELATFFDRIQPGDTVVFVFSGHGWSDGSENFLVPTDMRPGGSQTLLARESIALRNGVNGVIDEIAKRGAGLTLAIVDACRDNPFASDDGTRSIGMARGLSPVQAPTGTFVAFSAGAGQTALDRLSDTDPEPHSVFTRHFLNELAKPQDLQSAFKRTQRLVNEDAARIGHPQRPAYYDEVIGSACITGSCEAAVVPAAGIVAQPKPPQNQLTVVPKRNLLEEAAKAWDAFKDSNSVAALELFAEQYKGTAYAALAQERISNLTSPQPQVTTPAVRGPRPSWCPNAATQTERAICANDVLSGYDLQMNDAYRSLRKRLSGAARSRFTSEQKAWLGYRNSCGSNTACLDQAYRTRLNQIAY